jgi:PAS domain S-box-containing protein
MDTSDFFLSLFNNAQHNCIIILNTEGDILKVNKAFADEFGYSNREIEGKNFSILFTEDALKKGKPEAELQKVKSTGVATDDNYMVNKDGKLTWVSGESIFINTLDGSNNYIVKIFQNIHTQKQLERFLVESNEFIENVIESIKSAAVLVLDSMMHILKVNTAFIKMFELDARPQEGNRLTDLSHSFWMNEEMKKEIRNVIVTNQSVKGKKFQLTTKAGQHTSVLMFTKIMHEEPTLERKILVMIKELQP